MADELEEGEIQEDVAVTDQRNSPQSTARKVYLRVPSPPPSPVLSSVRPKKKKRKLTPPAATETKPGTQQTAGQKVLDQIYGQQGRAEVQIQALSSTTIRLPDVVGLVLWVLADGSNTRWVFIKNKALVQKVVMVAVPGIDADLFQEKKAGLPNMHTLLGPATKLQAKNATVRPGQTVSALFAVPMRKKRKREVAEEKQAGKRRRAPFPPSHYAMRLEQMEAHNFPLPEVSESGEMRCPEGYIATQPSGAAGAVSVPSERMVALDCEMCQTTAGLEVTRVTLIDEMCQVLLDELVLPHNPITDYVTRYSGITAAMMAGVTTRLADVQQRFLELVSAETLLVGHSLENDLLCLKIIHANILDTAVLFPHPRGPPYRSALRIITEKFLKRQIQNGSHDSIADARAAMELAQLKVKNGPSFGLGTTDEAFEKLMDVLGESNRRCTLVDRQDMLNRHVTGSAAAVVSTSDADALAKAIREAQNPAINFLWTQLRDLSTFFEERAQWRRQTAIVTAGAGQAPQQAQQDQQAQQRGQTHASGTGAENGHATTSKAAALHAGQSGSSTGQQSTQAQHSRAAVPGTPAKAVNGLVDDAVRLSTADGAEQPLADPAGPSGSTCTGRGAGQDASAQHAHRASPAEGASPSNGRPGLSNGTAAGSSALPSGQPASATDRAEASNGSVAGGPACTSSKPAGHDAQPVSANGKPAEAGEAAASRGSLPMTPAQRAVEDDKQVERLLATIDRQIGELHRALPPNTLLLVVTCQGDTAECRRLQEQKFRRQQGLDGLPPWSTDCEAEFARILAGATRALCFCSVKQ